MSIAKKVALAGVALSLVGVLAFVLFSRTSDNAPQTPVVDIINHEKQRDTKTDLEFNNKHLQHTVFVEVVDDTHAPIALAQVKLVGLGREYDATTDASGTAMIERVLRPIIRVELAARGFVQKKTTPVALTADVPEVSWSFEMQRVSDDDDSSQTDSIIGAVLSASKPVAGAMVIALRHGSDSVATSNDIQRTDSTGRFLIPNADPDLEPIDRVLAFHRSHGDSEIPFSRGDLVIELPPGGFVDGHVVIASDTPPTAVTVRATPSFASKHPVLRTLSRSVRRRLRKDPKDRRSNLLRLELDHLLKGTSLQVFMVPLDSPVADSATNTNDDTALPPGSFHIGPLAAGPARVVASSSGFQPDGADVVVPVSATKSGIVLTLGSPLTVTGLVTDSSSHKPLRGVRIFARMKSDREGRFGSATTGKDGRYVLHTESSRRQTLSASKRGYRAFDIGGINGGSGDELVRDFSLRRIKAGERKHNGYNRDYVGIGAQLKKTDDGVLVQKIFSGGAAADQLQEGDVIVQVEGEWVEDIPLQETVETILGDDGTDVELVVRRKGSARGDTERVILERRRIEAGGG